MLDWCYHMSIKLPRTQDYTLMSLRFGGFLCPFIINSSSLPLLGRMGAGDLHLSTQELLLTQCLGGALGGAGNGTWASAGEGGELWPLIMGTDSPDRSLLAWGWCDTVLELRIPLGRGSSITSVGDFAPYAPEQVSFPV